MKHKSFLIGAGLFVVGYLFGKNTVYAELGHKFVKNQEPKHAERSGRYSRNYTSYKKVSFRELPSIVFDTRGEAEEVLAGLKEVLNDYGQVSVADVLDFSGIHSEYQDAKFGWTDLSEASITQRNIGYDLRLPKAVSLD